MLRVIRKERNGCSHFEFVTPNFQRETAFDLCRLVVVGMALQLTCREKRIVCWIESNGTKLFPVSYHRRFGKDLM